jgi:hypothetical protein
MAQPKVKEITMDHGYHGKPRHPVPAPQFPTFIKAYEIEVSKAQQKLKSIESMHRPYEIVTGVITKLSWLNEVTVTLETHGIDVITRVLHEDRKEKFDQMLHNVCEELVSWRLRESLEVPNWNTLGYDFSTFIHTKSEPRCRIYFMLDVPIRGTKWIKVTETREVLPEPRVITTIRTEWLEESQNIIPEAGR